ncbi:GtrA family protein [Massilia sp. CCM 8733]|uniref:GtrA family protein n=1 Tax=Massilia mucilaginosa TaxID=2609282 RepID=A0ABX0NRY5_9BURK|nr:GtrA family protein [Massilia mucilaginosa]NHZ89367.1 GtrA family protein [Massilia mucilaginosa]
MKLASELLRFGAAGVAGLLVDLGVLALARSAGLDPYAGRVLSFLCAVFATWQINRRYTFHPAGISLWTEWWRYLLAMSGGGAVNFATYSAIVWLFSGVPHIPYWGVCAGSLAGMAVNFVGARWFVFQRKS